MDLRTDVIVLGAGIVGLCCALHLQRRGREVTLLDRHAVSGMETSFGNAGLIQPDGISPITFPRNLAVIASYLFNRRRDCYYHVSAMREFAPVLFRYWRLSHPQSVQRTLEANIPLFAESMDAHLSLAREAGVEAIFRPTGWTRAFRKKSTFETHREKLAKLTPYGVNAEELSSIQLRELEPDLNTSLVGAFRFTDQRSLRSPLKLSAAYHKLFVSKNGRTAVGDARSIISDRRGKFSIRTNVGNVVADNAVVCLGPWAVDILKPLGYALPFFVKRGYHLHFTTQTQTRLRNPTSDVDGGYSLTPMDDGIRLNTGVEFANRDAPPCPVQLNRVMPWARDFFPIDKQVEKTPWVGSRPCLPDMLPVIGPALSHPGLWFAFGHGHHGLTLAAATGRLLAEMMTDQPTFTDPAPYRAGRFNS